MKKSKIKLYQVVLTFDLETISDTIQDENAWIFRIEILKDCSTKKDRYFTKVYRQECYRLNLAFSNPGNFTFADAFVYVDDIRDWDEIIDDSPEKVLGQVISKFEEMFCISIKHVNSR